MNLSTASRTFQLLSRLLDPRSSTEPFVPPAGDKRALPLRPAARPFPRALPEECGVSSRHIRKFLEELSSPALHMHTVLILRRGRVISEAAFGSRTLLAPTYTFSACKSVVSLAVGLLVGDGVLAVTDKIGDFFEDIPGLRRRPKDLTVEDLLTMRAGLLFTEAEALTETDWVRRFLGAAQKSEPGTEFFYNSLNTYLLSALVCRRTGRGLTDFLRERLFTPMGITDVLWEKCPMGVEKGGWGLYIRPEDAAKLGQLVMDGGLWQGERLLSGEYLAAALAPHAIPPASTGDFNYGYQIWVGRGENTFLFNGMLGQNVLGFRDSGILVVTNAGEDTDFQESRYFEIVSRYFGGAFPEKLPPDPAGVSRLAETVRQMSSYNRPAETVEQAGELARPFLNRAFATEGPRALSVGLLPVVLQALHNNYTQGVESVAVSVRDRLPELIYREKGAVYRLPVGLGAPRVSELDFRGDVYQVAALGRFTHDEEERPVFYIRLDFVETPCVRIVKLVLEGNRMVLKQTETPGVPYVYRKLSQAAQSALYKPLLLVAAGGTEDDFLRYKTLQLLSPQIVFEPVNDAGGQQSC